MNDPSPETVENPVARARARLDVAGVSYEIVEHQPAFTAADEADAAGRAPRETAKTLVLLDHDSVRLAVIPASRRLDVARSAERSAPAGTCGSRPRRRRRSGSPSSRWELCGRSPPSAVTEVIDTRLLYHDTVLCPAGDHRHSVLLDPRDLVRLAEPRVADICARDPGDHRFADVPRV